MAKNARKRIDNSLTELVAQVRLATMLGTGGSSLSSYSTIGYANNYALISLNRIMLTYLLTGNGLFQTAVQLPIQDALSKRVEIESDELTADDIDQVLEFFEEQGLWRTLEDTWTWVRGFGGGALLINSNQDPEEPLNMRGLSGSPLEFYDLDRWQIEATARPVATPEGDFMDVTRAEFLYLAGHKIHRSRFIMGQGKRAPSYVRRQLRGWGLSEAERMIRDLNNYLKTQDVLYEILDESKVDVYKIQGLANKLLTAGGTSAVSRRLQAANEVKSYLNALVLDSQEEFEQKQIGFSGLAEVMEQNRIGIAAALRIPMVKLFGLSPSGFSTGDADLSNYNQMIESEVRAPIRGPLRKLIAVACQVIFGYVPSFRMKFPPLKELPEKEQEEIRTSVTERTLQVYDRGLLLSREVGEILRKTGAVDIDTAAESGLLPAHPPAAGGGEIPGGPQEPGMVGVVRNAWEEGKHKRDEGGQFSTAGGGGGKATAVADMTAMEEDERWTPEDRDALNAYQGEDYEVINGSLRRGEVSGETAKQVQALDRAFEKADTLKQGEYLFRFLTGFRNMALFKPGTVFEDKGFISTSKDRDYVTEIMGEDESIFIRIEAGKATKGIRLGGGEVDQGEVLLPRNSRFRVKRASSTGTKGVVVMEAI